MKLRVGQEVFVTMLTQTNASNDYEVYPARRRVVSIDRETVYVSAGEFWPRHRVCTDPYKAWNACKLMEEAMLAEGKNAKTYTLNQAEGMGRR